ncbi:MULTISPECIES: hypothetical protein [unclassified Methylobacterium]|uniref:hypothetical protein n=1 Tax=unclassified Methylobacterium TaxID=2615210 RepID=UPI0011C1E505|nr:MULTISPECIES: hypothetical protein [unclassified Methylobacterium]QEE39847.1 hypothetical protein FVA80_13665 [Methylobacterium sp. WL1]TXN57309.1 hypothetical protein FV241_11645 [Methylobacterium sp. WL2]
MAVKLKLTRRSRPVRCWIAVDVRGKGRIRRRRHRCVAARSGVTQFRGWGATGGMKDPILTAGGRMVFMPDAQTMDEFIEFMEEVEPDGEIRIFRTKAGIDAYRLRLYRRGRLRETLHHVFA